MAHRKDIPDGLLGVSTVAESTTCCGVLGEYLKILPLSLSLSLSLLSDFLKAHTILSASPALPLLHYLAHPTMLLSTALLLQISHSDHLMSSTVASPSLRALSVLVSVSQGYALCPLLNFLSLLRKSHPSLDANITCALVASLFGLLPSCQV